eukprot:CAMPEP_0198139000 /NCGR_PEP_ID=MMETSP1443-20131203/2329_1 /TAXON_ID=186043 /ORGANISM="Entomoneis sp., Strain CCMP2396" /LENGTH=92 /DNA_ID=CAMNT_0043800967 /DNA_START=77 /DNA_END=355 /DNA_ORIENTATION=-
MSRVLFFLALLVASASAFVSPANNAVAFARPAPMNMVPVEAIDVDAVSTFVQNANVIATSSDDFGGAFLPVAGISSLAVLILYLSPPLADEN